MKKPYQFPVTNQQVWDALDKLRKDHRIQEVGSPGLSPTILRYNVDGIEISAFELVAMAAK